jgi:hypothetical protein
MLNPIEIAWAELKNYVRDKNVSFSLKDVRQLAHHWMTSLSRETAAGYVYQTRKVEDTFKKSDRFTEEIEEQLVDEEDEVSSEVEEIVDQ